MPKLSKRIIDGLQPSPAGEVFAWDSELRGFGVRVMPSGVGSYVLKYRNSEGRQRKYRFGRIGELTPEEARNKARAYLVDVSQGGDPSADRRKLKQTITVAELCDVYMAEAVERLKPTTYSNNKSCLDRHVKPLIGRMTVTSLTPTDIAKLQSDIAAGKTSRERQGRGGVTTGGRAVASRTISVFGSVLEFAKQRKVVTENVMRGIERPPDNKRRRFLDEGEIGRLGAAMRDAENDGESPTGIAAVRFLLLSGCRRREALALPRTWLDQARGCIRFGDTKSGAQLRPIGKEAFAALPRSNSEWVFPADRGPGHFIGLPKVLGRLCKRAGIEGVSVHVLRHSFAAMAAEMGFSELTIAGMLGHTVPGITARYAHVPDSALVAAADRVSERIASLLNIQPEKI